MRTFFLYPLAIGMKKHYNKYIIIINIPSKRTDEIMKKYLLPEKGMFYKANMHTHTTVSDGRMSPEEIKKAYTEKGYSIVAYTDHDILMPHNDLSDEKFLAITACEIEINLYHTLGTYPFIKTYHLNLYSENSEKAVMPVWDSDYVFPQVKPLISEEQKRVEYKREYTIDKVNEAIALAKAEGFFVSYNHPVWSLQDYADYSGLEGIWGVECFNSDCVRVGMQDTDRPLNDMLTLGKRVFPLATDDTHHPEDCFGGFIMVKAEKLEYATVVEALKKGDFYASTAPEIKELYIENGVVHIATSPVQSITLNTERRYALTAKDDSGNLTSATFDLRGFIKETEETPKWRDAFFRITVKDAQGKVAYTRAYFLDEMK